MCNRACIKAQRVPNTNPSLPARGLAESPRVGVSFVVVIVVLVVYFQLLTLLVRLAARYVRAGDKSNTVGVLRSRNVYQDMGRFHEPVLLTIQYLASAEAREIKSKLMVER